MNQTLDFIIYAQHHQSERERIENCMKGDAKCSVVVDRHRIDFDPQTQMVTISASSESVPFAIKIGKCRMTYRTLKNLLDGIFDDIEGFEWLL